MAEAAQPGWDHVFDRYGFEWALISPRSTLADLLTELPEWDLVYVSSRHEHPDAAAVVFRRVEKTFP